MKRRRLLPALAALAVLRAQPLTADPGTAAAAPETLMVVLADWHADALGHEAAGRLAWVAAGDGALRVDLLAFEGGAGNPAGHATPQALLARQGQGWTLVAGPGDPGVAGSWDREWRRAPAGLADLARAVMAGRRARLVLHGDVPSGGPAEVGVVRPAGDFRQSLVRRGRGGGGPGEHLAVTAPEGDDVVRIRSSRRPGSVAITRREAGPAAGDPASVFLPWYPLAEVLVPVAGGAPIPGTSDLDPR